jgi:hypothetical protein
LQVAEATLKEKIALHVDDYESSLSRMKGEGIWLRWDGDVTRRSIDGDLLGG